MKKVNDLDLIEVTGIRVLHFRYNDRNELKRYSRKNHAKNGFRPQTKGGMTVVAVTFVINESIETVMGSSNCSKMDNFNYKTGRVLAIENALGKLGNYTYESAKSLDDAIFRNEIILF